MKTFHGRFTRVRALAYLPDGSSLASAGKGGLVRIWDPSEGRVREQYRSGFSRVSGLAFSPDGSTLGSAANNLGVNLRSLADGTNSGFSEERRSPATSLAFRADGRALLSCGARPHSWSTEGHVTIWSLESRKSVARMDLPCLVWSAAYHPDGARVVLGAGAAGILVWDPARFPRAAPAVGAWAGRSQDGSTPGVDCWAVPQSTEPRCLRFSPDGRLLAAAAGWSVHLYDVAEGLRIATLKGHRQSVRSVAFSPDGMILASGSHDGTVRFWDVEDQSERARFDWEIGQVDGVAFAPDGMTVAAGGEGGIVVWDVE